MYFVASQWSITTLAAINVRWQANLGGRQDLLLHVLRKVQQYRTGAPVDRQNGCRSHGTGNLLGMPYLARKLCDRCRDCDNIDLLKSVSAQPARGDVAGD